MLIVQIYVDDILFGSTNNDLCEEFSLRMRSEFEMSMMGELGFFLGFEIKQRESGTFINQSKYTRELIKKFGLEGGKSMNTPMSPNSQLDKDTQGKHIDQKVISCSKLADS